WIAFVSNRSADPDKSDNTDIFVVSPTGAGLKPLAENPGPDNTPVWSHAGDRLAFHGQLRPNDYYQINRRMVVHTAGDAPNDLTGARDTWVSADALLESSQVFQPAQWSPDDKTLFTTLDKRGANVLVSVPSAGGEVEEMMGGDFLIGQVRLATVCRD